ncbi:MAG: HEAT repeat domain-containing protein [Deltaproteobacteria bacterium]|nr:HEAT repeat domain-containing protein [Deltaproteobacteria bacterium]
MALRSDDAEERRTAAAGLADWDTARAVPFLTGALDDPVGEVRLHVATSVLRLTVDPVLNVRAEEVLLGLASGPAEPLRGDVLRLVASGAIADPKAVRLVRDRLADDSETVRVAAIRAARDRMLEDLAPAVTALLRDEVPAVRETAAEALGILFAFLGEHGGAEVEEAVSALQAVLEDPEGEVRGAAARALGLIGPPAAAPLLADAVVTALAAALERPEDRDAVVFGLFGQGERGVRAALDKVDLVPDPEPLAAHIALLGPPAIPLLAELLRDPRAHRVALAGLRRLGARAMSLVEPVALMVRQGGAAAREAALTLAALGPPALPVLARLLEDPVGRGPAAAAIPALGQTAASLVPDLAILAASTHPERLDAIRALVAIGPDALSELVELLDHGQYATRRAVLDVLEDAPQEELFAIPLRALFDPHPRIRGAAVRVLGAWREVARPVASELVGMLADDQPRVRAAAAWALGEIGRVRRPDPFARPWAPPGAEEALRSLLADPHPRAQREAAIALRKLGRQAAG